MPSPCRVDCFHGGWGREGKQNKFNVSDFFKEIKTLQQKAIVWRSLFLPAHVSGSGVAIVTYMGHSRIKHSSYHHSALVLGLLFNWRCFCSIRYAPWQNQVSLWHLQKDNVIGLSFFIYFYVSMCVFVYVSECHMCFCVHGSQLWVFNPPEMEVQVFLDLWTWVLGTPNSCPLGEQRVSLTTAPSLQPQRLMFWFSMASDQMSHWCYFWSFPAHMQV